VDKKSRRTRKRIKRVKILKLNDVDKYPKFILRHGRLIPVELWEVEGMTFDKPMEWHHFVEKQIRKNSPKRYAELEDKQKMILLEKDFHHSLPNMSDKRVKEQTGLHKYELIYLRNHDYRKD